MLFNTPIGATMRSLLIAAVALLSTAIMSAGTAIPGVTPGVRKFKLNNGVGKNALTFVSKAPAEDINGTADGLTGAFDFDPSNIENAKGTIEVSVRSMKTAMTKRDDHMYSPVWLDADKYPNITFQLTNIQDVTVSTNGQQPTVIARATGKFTLHGVTKSFQAPIVLTYVKESADTKKRSSGDLIALKVSFEIYLKDFDIKGKEGVVGKSVGEKISIEANLFANS
ncbi:MAG: YceI family protein [Candidatus Kapabacteria bacterium]|nr:YceI family protein [Candidatus Kapabacteria bacterium]